MTRRVGTTGLRIAYVHQYYNNRTMLGSTRSYELARRLVAAGHTVDLLTSDRRTGPRGQGWRTTDDDGITVHWFGVPYSGAMSYARRLRSFGEFAVAASWRLRSVEPDLVFATSTPLTVAVPGVLGARHHRVPFVFEVRDLWPEVPIEMGVLRSPVSRWLANRLADVAYGSAARVVALSPGMAAGVVRRGYPGECVTVVPNACDLDLFRPDVAAADRWRRSLPWLQDRPLVLYAGSIGKVNRLEFLLEVAARAEVLDPEVRFAVVGDGGEVPRLQALARELGVLDRNLFFLPRVPKEELPGLLTAASVATSVFAPLPTMQHNSSNKFADALAAGCPVAVNHPGWQAELLRRTGAGIVLDGEDPAAAADDLVRLVRDDDRLARAGAAARATAEREFSRDAVFQDFERVLLAAAAGPASPRPRLAATRSPLGPRAGAR